MASRIEDQLRHGFDGDPWHGPSLVKVLEGVTAVAAACRPIAGAHSIWELVLHLAVWRRVAIRWLDGQPIEIDISGPEDWPAPPEASDTAWARCLDALHATQAALLDRLATLDPARLKEIVPGRQFTLEFALDGVVQHDAYHAGQIMSLKRALGL